MGTIIFFVLYVGPELREMQCWGQGRRALIEIHTHLISEFVSFTTTHSVLFLILKNEYPIRVYSPVKVHRISWASTGNYLRWLLQATSGAATEPATSQGPGDPEGGPVKGNLLVTSRSVSFGERVFCLDSFLLICALNTL